MGKGKWKKRMAALLAAGLAVAGSGYGRAAGSSTDEAGFKMATLGTPIWVPCGDGVADPIARRVTARIPEPGPDTAGENREGTDADAEEARGNRGFRAAKDYQEILDVLRGGNRYFYGGMNYFYAMDSAEDAGMMDGTPAGDISTNAGRPGTAEPSGEDYSDTNVQVEGIAEADIVKTDGKYIYILSKKEEGLKIYIVRAEEGELTLESSFSPDDSLDSWQEEMYVSGNQLVVVRCGRKPQDEYGLDLWFGYYGERQTQVLVYDITDRKAPFLAGSHIQDGDYVSSREKDGWLYVVSEKGISYRYIQPLDRIWIEDVDRPEEEAANDGDVSGDDGTKGREPETELSGEDLARLPFVDGEPIAPGCIYFREDCADPVYTIVTAIGLEAPKQPADSISFMAGSGHCYMSGNAIYLAAYDWYQDEGDSDHTGIVKISYAEGKMELVAQGKVKGSLDDQFSMDEKDGYLRVVTTVEKYQAAQEAGGIWKRYLGRSNALYVLDPGLKVVGFLEGLAEDERIYSARFIGDIAYFVTFRNTDPLFAVDVSDPAHPVLLGALKIPGFSDYLHPYGEDLLLGIGYDADGTGVVKGVKLTMFDISDPLAVVEKHTLVLNGFDSSEACYNHRAVLVDEGKNLIGLPFEGSCYGEDGYQDYTEEKGYAVYGYDVEKGFYQRFEKGYVRKWDWKYYDYDDQPEMPIDAVDEIVPEEGVAEPVNGGQAGSTAELWEETDQETEDGNLAKREVKDGNVLVDGDWNNWYHMRLRGVYIGDYFYLINQIEEVCSYQMGQDGFLEAMQMKLR